MYVFLTIWSQPIDSLFVLAFLFARTLQKVSLLQSYYQIVVFELPAFAFMRPQSQPHVGQPNPTWRRDPSLRIGNFPQGGQLLVWRRERLAGDFNGAASR